MVLRKAVVLLVAVSMVASAGCLGVTSGEASSLGSSHDVSQAGAGSGKSISVTGSGSASMAPDQTVISFVVSSRAADAATARDRVAANASALTAYLAEAGVPADGVVTRYYSLSPVTRPGESSPSEYRAVHAFTVTLNGTDRAGEIVDGGTSHGANQVSNVQFTLSDGARASLRGEALRAAMANARSDADVLAEQSDLSIAGVHSVSTSNYSPVPVTYASGASGSTKAKTSFSPGPVSVTATVSVTYDAD